MATVGLLKKGLIAFERQQESLRRHLARIIYSNTEEGAAYFKEKAREEMAEVIRERVEEYRRKEAELEAQAKEKVGSKNGVTKLEVIEEEVKENWVLKALTYFEVFFVFLEMSYSCRIFQNVVS